MLALRLPPSIEKRLARLAKKTGRTKSFYAREAILRHIEDLEDGYLARQRVARRSPRLKLEALECELLPLKHGDILRLQVTKKGIVFEKVFGARDEGTLNFSEWSSAADKKAFRHL